MLKAVKVVDIYFFIYLKDLKLTEKKSDDVGSRICYKINSSTLQLCFICFDYTHSTIMLTSLPRMNSSMLLIFQNFIMPALP